MFATKIISPIQSTAKAIYNKIPNISVQKNNVINSVSYIGRKWTSPQQRLIMGATAIFMQPFIDAKNPNVNNETKKVSVAKTISKILVGTTTGVIIRALCIKGIKTCSAPLNSISKDTLSLSRKFKTILTPEGATRETEALQQYRNAMGTLLSLGIMLFTNFAVDAPLTNKLTNYLIGTQKTKAMLSKFIGEDQAKKGENK